MCLKTLEILTNIIIIFKETFNLTLDRVRNILIICIFRNTFEKM